MSKVILAAILLLGVRSGMACTCGGPNPVCSVHWSTDTLFLGHVVRVEHVDNQHLVHFDVTKVYRGERSSEQMVIHTPGSGFGVRVGC
jgi:hypothetical protein